MSSTNKDKAKPVAKKRAVASKEFRTVFVSAFGIRARENDFTLTLGAEVEENGEEIIQNELRAMMTPRSAKVLFLSLKGILDKFEAAVGPIQLAPGKEEELLASPRGVSDKPSRKSAKTPSAKTPEE